MLPPHPALLQTVNELSLFHAAFWLHGFVLSNEPQTEGTEETRLHLAKDKEAVMSPAWQAEVPSQRGANATP